ncbi:unnamed protein product [Brachionus calyciflorus]|uniref:Cilia- and flagella-associated protein 77 n=1 Tax=Brachionus calyciflorus TaxID=104777 RepID=A0A813WNB9_9BILA|nr:unnamed protein product [Brachionus calyciflorus]
MSENTQAKSAPLRTDKRFEITKTGLIGSQRDTMLQNELHYLPQLGKSRTRGHQLPSADTTYGVKYEKLDGGVPEALQHWINLAKDSQSREERYRYVRDFIALNKEAIKSGCVNTKQNDQYRSLNDIKRKVRIGGGPDSSSSNNGFARSKVSFPPGMTFGMPHRPSTPIHEVLEYRFLHDWLNDMQTIEAARVNSRKEASKAISGAYHTKSSWLKNAKIPVEEKPLWKMPRFRNVEAAVDTFRHPTLRQKALSSHELDKVPREGVNAFEQGVYTVNTTSLPA